MHACLHDCRCLQVSVQSRDLWCTNWSPDWYTYRCTYWHTCWYTYWYLLVHHPYFLHIGTLIGTPIGTPIGAPVGTYWCTILRARDEPERILGAPFKHTQCGPVSARIPSAELSNSSTRHWLTSLLDTQHFIQRCWLQLVRAGTSSQQS